MREKPNGDNLQRDGGPEEGKTGAASGTQRGSGTGRDIAFTSGTRSRNLRSLGSFFYRLAFERDDKYNVNPFAIEAAIRSATGVTPKEMFSLNKTSMVIEMECREGISHINKIKAIEDIQCEITPYLPCNTSRGLIFIDEYDLSSFSVFEEFENDTKREYNIKEVTRASFIKTRNLDTRPLILTFDTPMLPYSIYIPGERQDSFIQPFINKPILCTKCQQYGHTRKNCRALVSTCKRCATEGHALEECTSHGVKCRHCQQPHLVGAKECPQQIKECAIIKLIEQKKVSFQRARQMMAENVHLALKT